MYAKIYKYFKLLFDLFKLVRNNPLKHQIHTNFTDSLRRKALLHCNFQHLDRHGIVCAALHRSQIPAAVKCQMASEHFTLFDHNSASNFRIQPAALYRGSSSLTIVLYSIYI